MLCVLVCKMLDEHDVLLTHSYHLCNKQRVGTKHSVTHGTYTYYAAKDKAIKDRKIRCENGPAGATRHFAVPETIGRRLKSEYLIVKSPFCDIIGLGLKIR